MRLIYLFRLLNNKGVGIYDYDNIKYLYFSASTFEM